jgi:sporulation protein YlmC with PRC-barrel domain
MISLHGQEQLMRHILYAGLTALLVAPIATGADAQQVGEKRLGVTVIELADVIKGVSAQRQLLGQPVYNDKNERVGKVEDIIITPERAASYAIVSTGGFLGIGAHDVAIPAGQIQMNKDRLVLPGATKESIRAMPPFEYARK